MPKFKGLAKVSTSMKRDEKNRADNDFKQHEKDKGKKYVLVEKFGHLTDLNDVHKHIVNIILFLLMAEDFSKDLPGSILFRVIEQYVQYFEGGQVVNWAANHRSKIPQVPLQCACWVEQSLLLMVKHAKSLHDVTVIENKTVATASIHRFLKEAVSSVKAMHTTI